MKIPFFFIICQMAAAVAASAQVSPELPVIPSGVFNITNYGAIGDGVTTNTTAIQNTINAASTAGGGTVEVPAGTFLSGPLTLQSSINLQLDTNATLRMLPFGAYPVTWYTNDGDIYFVAGDFITGNDLSNIEISGSGSIDGQGQPWWPWANTNNAVRPIMIWLNNCNRELIQNVTLSNSPRFHIAFGGGSSANIAVQGVTVRAPSSSANPPSHNTDACDVHGTNILVQNCNISCGDDDFACGGFTANVLLTNNTYGNGHGVSIGSYTDDGGVSNITVVNCTFNGTENGLRIKSDNDRGGLVQNIHYYNISMTNVDLPIVIYSYYNEAGSPNNITPVGAASEPVAAVVSTTPIYRDITFSNITATGVSGNPIGVIWARTEMPATNIVFNDVNIIGDLPFGLYNVSGAQFIDCNLMTSPGLDTFALFNAQSILTNSTPPGQLFTFDGLTTNDYDNSLAFYNAQGSLTDTNALGDGPLTLSASTFIVSNNLTMFPSTVFNYTLGSTPATMAMAGNLALGGTFNVSAGNGFTTGTYTLLTYGGTLSGSPPALGTVPAGYSYSFNNNPIGQVNLVVMPIPTQPPPTPTNLTATAGNNSITLTWSPSATATSYDVKRALVSGGESATNATLTINTYTDTQVTNGTTYYYVVSAVNAVGQSQDSAEASATAQASVVTTNLVTTNVFIDNFSSSSLNSASPDAPTPGSTSYEINSSKNWDPMPSLATGNLKFGIGSTSSGTIEAQALFANPVTLINLGDSVSLVVTFTNTAGLLTADGVLGFGLYQGGQNFPVPGGLNGTATDSSSDNATGNAQTWVGYVGQLAFTGGDCKILTRPAQTEGTDNNDQDVMTSGSSSSYDAPAGTAIGSASSAPSVALVAGNPYTDVLTLTLASSSTLAITNSLYSGTSTNGSLLSQFGGVTSGATYLTNAFDALSVGWREEGSQATAIDINSIGVSSSSIVTLTNFVSLNPIKLVFQVSGNQLQLSWPADHLGWTLQTNSAGLAAANAWFPYPGSPSLTNVSLPIDSTTNVFFRLIYNP